MYETIGTTTIFLNSDARDYGNVNNFTKLIDGDLLDKKLRYADRIKIKLIDWTSVFSIENISENNNKFTVGYRTLNPQTQQISDWIDQDFVIPPGIYTDKNDLLTQLNILTGAVGPDGNADLEFAFKDDTNILGVKINKTIAPYNEEYWRISFNNYSAETILGSPNGVDLEFLQLQPFTYFDFPINLRFTNSIFVSLSCCRTNVIALNLKRPDGSVQKYAPAQNCNILARINIGNLNPGEIISFTSGGDNSPWYSYLNKWDNDITFSIYDENYSYLKLNDPYNMTLKVDFQKIIPSSK